MTAAEDHARRQERARAALTAYDQLAGEHWAFRVHEHRVLEECLPDLLTDLMHLIDAERVRMSPPPYGPGWTGSGFEVLRDLLQGVEYEYSTDAVPA